MYALTKIEKVLFWEIGFGRVCEETFQETEDKIYVNGEVHKWDTYKLAT